MSYLLVAGAGGAQFVQTTGWCFDDVSLCSLGSLRTRYFRRTIIVDVPGLVSGGLAPPTNDVTLVKISANMMKWQKHQ